MAKTACRRFHDEPEVILEDVQRLCANFDYDEETVRDLGSTLCMERETDDACSLRRPLCRRSLRIGVGKGTRTQSCSGRSSNALVVEYALSLLWSVPIAPDQGGTIYTIARIDTLLVATRASVFILNGTRRSGTAQPC